MGRKIIPRSVILITGTPGSGKTTLAKAWCKKSGWTYLGLNDLVNEKKLYTSIDPEDGAKVVQLQKLESEANRTITKTVPSMVVEGHLGCDIKLAVDRVLVLRLRPDELRSRLSERSYALSKIDENVMAEMLDYCTLQAQAKYGVRRVYEIDTTDRTPGQNLANFSLFLSSTNPNKTHPASVSWSKELQEAVLS